jgi:ABC-type antimicrobial peptide transport system permease subunit
MSRVAFVLLLATSLTVPCAAQPDTIQGATVQDTTSQGVRITVDPRIELMGVVQLLTDYPLVTDYASPYRADVQAYFAPHKDRRLRTLGLSLIGVALVLVVLGLFSMAAYLTRLRRKEVAIRKALGATATSILRLLNREFVLLTGVATVLGSVAGYLAMDRWLARFATRINISPFVFLGIGAGALLLAVAAVSVQALPAARIDPAQVLRSE